MVSFSNRFPSWGDSGEAPSDGFEYNGGDQVNEKHLDYLWDSVRKQTADIIDEFDILDSDLTDHINDTTNPHNVTSDQVGSPSDSEFTSHVTDTTNPHNVTSDQVGSPSDSEFTSHTGDSDAHHSRYTDGEARQALEDGNVSQIDGTNDKRIRFEPSWIEITDQSNNRAELVTDDVYSDQAGEWLADHISDSNAHHSRYTDSEAAAAAPVQSVNGQTGDIQLSQSLTTSFVNISRQDSAPVDAGQTKTVQVTETYQMGGYANINTIEAKVSETAGGIASDTYDWEGHIKYQGNIIKSFSGTSNIPNSSRSVTITDLSEFQDPHTAGELEVYAYLNHYSDYHDHNIVAEVTIDMTDVH